MTIKTTVANVIEVEMPVPFFSKSVSDQFYIGLLDENTVIKFSKIQNYTSVQNGDLDTFKSDLAAAFETYTHISEREFLSAYNSIIESISLKEFA